MALVAASLSFSYFFIVLSCKSSLRFAMQMETVSQPLFEFPDGVNDTVDRPENVISHRRNPERQFLESGLVPRASLQCPGAMDRATARAKSRCGGFITPEHGLTDAGRGTLISTRLIMCFTKA